MKPILPQFLKVNEKMEILTLSKDTAIDIDTAKKILCDFCFDQSNKRLTKSKLQEIIPSIYSFVHHNFLEENSIGLPKLIFNLTRADFKHTIASTIDNTISFNISNKTFLNQKLNNYTKFHLIHTLFHEMTHINDFNDDNYKFSLFKPNDMYYSFVVGGFIDDFTDELYTHHKYYGFNPDKISKSDLKQDLVKKYLNKYWFSNIEQHARKNANELAYLLGNELENSTEQNYSNELVAHCFKKEIENQIADENKNENEFKDFTDHPELTEPLEKYAELHLKEFVNSLDKVRELEKEDSPQNKRDIEIELNCANLYQINMICALNMSYNQEFARNLYDTIMSYSDLENFELGFVHCLINYTNFVPTPTQALEIARVNREQYDNLQNSSSSGMVSILEMSDTTKVDELLKFYMVENPDFLDELEYFDSEYIFISDKQKEYYKDFYLSIDGLPIEMQIDNIMDSINQKQNSQNQNTESKQCDLTIESNSDLESTF